MQGWENGIHILKTLGRVTAKRPFNSTLFSIYKMFSYLLVSVDAINYRFGRISECCHRNGRHIQGVCGRSCWIRYGSARPGGDTWRGPWCPELLAYQKKDGRTWSGPSFLWYDTDFSEFLFFFYFISFFIFWKVGTHPSFGMTTSQDIRDLFA